ncbi:MAG: nickel pincer cofactor biosynthesis protein LarC [Fibromonadaceae bacterium]|jgi:uncharacterized protein (TIGR00299 family) protein|nr:nickel pincer cofactor biosynthesis protein LarC [Fibromonadaceae bacterium]
MKTLYFECNMGAAGDMLMAALLELHNNPKEFLGRLNNIGIPGVAVTTEKSSKCGIMGTHVKIKIGNLEEAEHEHEHEHHHHHHNDYHSIEHLIEHLNVSDIVKKNALGVYKLIAEAESHAHGVPVDKIHFHEVGEMDAVTDIVGVCMLIEELAPNLILASPVNVGSGQVRCAHGILPVPAPATARILRNTPIYSDDTIGELCTPTGAALLKYFAKDFCKMSMLSVDKLGYGMGKKDFDKVNCVRAYIGNSVGFSEKITELLCNLDDMTPEAVSFAQQLLLQEGALDAYTMPIGMKKGRTGLIFVCMCRTDAKSKMLSLIFKHTSTLGIREYTCHRHALQREETELKTELGTVRVKTARGFGLVKSKPEYEDIARIALEKNKSIEEVFLHYRSKAEDFYGL